MHEEAKQFDDLQSALPKLAHDIRSPLGAIWGYLSLLQEREEDPKKKALFLNMIDGCDSINKTLTTYTEFARPLPFKREEVELCSFLTRFVEEASSLSDEAEFALSLPKEPLLFSIDPKLMKSALLQLVVNALEASPSAQKITIGLKEEPIGLFVKDQGPGVLPEDQEKLFTLFFTKKERGRGLGLSLVKKIASLHGGFATLTSSEEGTVVTITLEEVP